MGRYSFFILSFCYRGNYVYADSISGDLLSDSSSYANDSSSDSSAYTESGFMDSISHFQQEKNSSQSLPETSSEESISDSLEDDSYFQEFRYDWVINDRDRNQDGIPNIMPMAIWDNSFFKKFTSDNGIWYVNGTFNGWRLSGNWATDLKAVVPAIQNSIYTTNARVDDVRRLLDSTRSTVSSHSTNISNAFKRITNLETWKTSQQSWNNTVGNNITSLLSWRKTQQLWNNTISSNVDSLNSWKSSQQAWNGHAGNNINSLLNWRTAQQTLNSQFGKSITDLNSWKTAQQKLNDSLGNNLKGLNSWQEAQKKWNSNFGSWRTAQQSWNNSVGNAVNSLQTWRTAQVGLNSVFGSTLSDTQQRVKILETKVNSFGFDDIGIIAAIIGLHDTWKSKDYNATILPDDGDAVKLMKSTANKIGSSVANNISLLRGVFGKDGTYWAEYDKRWTNFPLWLQGLFNNYFDNIYNMKNKDSLLYRLIYFFIDEMTKTRDFVIEINDNVLIANDSLLIVIDWLRMIYSKPPVVSPPFDYDRLAKMLSEIQMNVNVGDTINEAGDNLWTVLKELIKNLGSIFETGLKELGATARAILDFLDSLIDKIIDLIVPKNIKFLDTGFDTIKSKIDIKFGSFLSLGNQVKEVVQPINQDFKKVVSIDILGAKFNPDFSTIDWVVVRFRTVMALSIWMSVAIYIYRKITGNGDLINDN